MGIYRLNEYEPIIDPTAYIAPGAQIIGNVEIKANASIWFNAVLRGDNEKLTIEEGANVQDGSVVHADPGYPTYIGKNVTIGHNCVIHGCTIEEDVVIGMNGTVLNGATIKKQAFVAAGSLVLENKVIEEKMLAAGVPAKPLKPISDSLVDRAKEGAVFYQNNGKRFKENNIL
ncbi:gamma carbonic anhydrase family protein [Caldibacillus lycopersici]|uniref:Gamma carbonic anhydrase family protein n=1 Tax=Perspicuibacillus lycopersici TaxID=1325689 RepID=A0AAE3IV80_9BACI|nr:gamma carbonic anhydrase family protein [Perspicuibacillus lycopersici]MCU9613499.1 gamma carbonic anhydrase family protein [Perspicuibacillus lycopersici]